MDWQTAVYTLSLTLGAAVGVVLALYILPRRAQKADPRSGWLQDRFRPVPDSVRSLACSAVIESMSDAAIMLDGQERIVNLNPAAGRIIGYLPSEAINRRIDQVLPDYADLLARCCDATDAPFTIALNVDQAQRHFDMCISPLQENHSHPDARLIVFHDVTGRVQTEQALSRADAETVRQLNERTALQETWAVIASTLKLSDVLSHAAEQMAHIVNATSAHVCGWKPETRTCTVLTEYIGPNACESEQASDLGVSYVMADQRFLDALAVGEPWMDFPDDLGLPRDERNHLQRHGAKTILYIPLRSRDEKFGFAELWESRLRREFPSEEISLCHTIAQNAAIAIENARLYEQVQKELDERVRVEGALRALNEELEQQARERTAELTEAHARLAREIDERARAETEFQQRNRELLSLQSAAAATASSLDLNFVLETVTWEMANLLEVEDCAICEWDQETDTISVIAEYGATSRWEGQALLRTYELADYPVKKRMLVERHAQQITASEPDIDPAELNYIQAANVKTLLMVPMVFQDRTVGLVEIRASQAERTFSDREIVLTQMLANQAASAIENARLYAETQKRLREQTALREAGAIISSALDPKTVLTRIAEQMARAVNASSAYICGFNPASMTSVVLANYVGPQAGPKERLSGLGVSYLDVGGQFLTKMRSGEHDISHVDDPDLSEVDKAHLQKYGAQTVLYVPLLIRGRVMGFAELWESRRRREFTQEEISLCHGIAQQAAIAIENARLYARARREIAERERAEEQIRASLKEKEVLLQEIHHRVKNNLQVVSSLLNLQSRHIEDEAALEMFQESQNRIQSMALIHEKLYRSDDLARIDLAEYIRSLATDLVQSYRANSGPVTLRINASDVFLSIDAAVPCGLIVNELVSNALKHAFPTRADTSASDWNGKEDEICIDLRSDDENQVTLTIKDNGVGFPRELDFQTLDSLGLRLINTLVDQLEGRLELNNSDGSEIKIVFASS